MAMFVELSNPMKVLKRLQLYALIEPLVSKSNQYNDDHYYLKHMLTNTERIISNWVISIAAANFKGSIDQQI